jgi:hypothetical protein
VSYSSEVLADSPLLYWRMGDSSGTTVTDSSGNGRNGTYVNSPTLGVAGLVDGDSNTAVSFDGSNDYANIADAAWMDVTTITLEAGIKLNATGAYQNIIDRDNGGAGRIFQFRVSNTNKLEAIVWRTGDGPYVLAGSTTLTAGTKYHTAMVYDGASSIWKLYVNGVEDANGGLAGSLKTGTQQIVVGGSQSGGGGAPSVQFFNGVIDEVAIYGTGLSAARIGVHSAAMGSVIGRKFQSMPSVRRDAIVRASRY